MVACFETNMRAPFLCCREFLPDMIARGRGRIINVASGGDVSTDPATSLVLFLASGRADELSGRFFAVPEDPATVVERAAEVRREDLYALRMRTLV